MVMIDYGFIADHLITAQIAAAILLLPHQGKAGAVVGSMNGAMPAITVIAVAIAADLLLAQLGAASRNRRAILPAVATVVLASVSHLSPSYWL
jgi:hypothetical protein